MTTATETGALFQKVTKELSGLRHRQELVAIDRWAEKAGMTREEWLRHWRPVTTIESKADGQLTLVTRAEVVESGQ
jgi:hypothetical protein